MKIEKMRFKPLNKRNKALGLLIKSTRRLALICFRDTEARGLNDT